MVQNVHHMHFEFNDEEYDTLREKSKQCGLSMSGFLRSLIMGKQIRARPPEVLKELYQEINRIGVNVNQIARNCNTGADPESCAKQALFLLKKINMLLDRIAN